MSLYVSRGFPVVANTICDVRNNKLPRGDTSSYSHTVYRCLRSLSSTPRDRLVITADDTKAITTILQNFITTAVEQNIASTITITRQQHVFMLFFN